VGLLKIALLGLLAGSALVVAPTSRADPGLATPISGASLERRQVTDGLGRPVTYYVSRPRTPAPLLLMIQGSGCAAVLHTNGAQTYSTLFDLLPFASDGAFTVVAVEKPFSDPGGSGGTASNCPAKFNADFTAESWLAALEASLDDASRQPWVDHRRMLVLGVSEGAVMASLLAGRDTRITDVIAVSGSGTGQLFDFIAQAYARCFDRTPCIDDIERQVRAINAKPDSSTDFAWGHPFKRWSSFFRVDPGEELLRSRARVYLAFGTADASVPPLSPEVAAAKLLAAGRDVTVRRVANADHALSPPGNADLGALDAAYRAGLAWFWQAPTRRP
jgi:dienelactone hydrolase